MDSSQLPYARFRYDGKEQNPVLESEAVGAGKRRVVTGPVHPRK